MPTYSGRFPWEEEPAAAPPPAHEAAKAEDEERAIREAYPPIEEVEKEAYPSLHDLYREIRRLTPRPPKREEE